MNSEILKYKFICIYGPTASGKSKLALEIAEKTDAIIINADSMQIYKMLPILSSQPNVFETQEVEHKLYGIIKLEESFSVNKWLSLVKQEIQKHIDDKKTIIIVGGTGLYFSTLINGIAYIPDITEDTKSKVNDLIAGLTYEEIYDLLHKYDKSLYNKLKLNDTKRILRGLEVVIQTKKSILEWQLHNEKIFPNIKFYKIYVCPERENLYQFINERFLTMIKYGVIEEVEEILEHFEKLPKIIGLSTIKKYLEKEIIYDDMVCEVQKLTRNYAKRQYTWFNNQIKHDLIVK
jgi:tRNA dimethylallyltransferase